MHEGCVKVLTCNIQDGGKGRLAEIAAVIRSQNPDVVAIQEANSRLRTLRLARGLGMQMVFGRANSRHHVAWLSRLPVLRHTNHRVAPLSKTLLEVEVAWNGKPLRLFATHLAGGQDTVHPAQEAPVILDILRGCTGIPHLLVGDFNALAPGDEVGSPPPSFGQMKDSIDVDPRMAIRLIQEAGYLDCYRLAHPGQAGYTFPAESPWLRFDYIFASPEIAGSLLDCGVVTSDVAARASDHLPVWAELSHLP